MLQQRYHFDKEPTRQFPSREPFSESRWGGLKLAKMTGGTIAQCGDLALNRPSHHEISVENDLLFFSLLERGGAKSRCVR